MIFSRETKLTTYIFSSQTLTEELYLLREKLEITVDSEQDDEIKLLALRYIKIINQEILDRKILG